MRFTLLPDDYCTLAPRPRRPRVPFEAGIVALILVLCVLYGLVFAAMVYVSLQEQVVSPHAHAPGLGGRPHFHSPAEWVLLVFPALIGWTGAYKSIGYLVARARLRQ